MAKHRGKGEGGVYQRKDGLWVATVERGRDARGKRLRAVAKRRTKAQALDALKSLQREAEVGIKPDKTRRLADYLDWWLENVAPETAAEDTVDAPVGGRRFP